MISMTFVFGIQLVKTKQASLALKGGQKREVQNRPWQKSSQDEIAYEIFETCLGKIGG